MKASLAVDLAGVKLPTPVLAASGCLRSPRELSGLLDVRKLGAIVTTSITMLPSEGSPPGRVVETPSGVLASVGLQNPGIETFVARELPPLLKTGVPVFVSIAGWSVGEYVQVASLLQDVTGIAGIEVNLACASVERGGAVFAHRADHAAEVVGAVSRLSRHPVFAKLSGDVADIVDIARSCVQAGAHGLTLINSVAGMAISTRTRLPELGAVTGTVSGPAIRPLAVRSVFAVSRALPEVPVLGVGGIATANDALEMMLAGAWAVQIGTAMLVDPAAPIEVTKGILQYLRDSRSEDPAAIRGGVRIPGESRGD